MPITDSAIKFPVVEFAARLNFIAFLGGSKFRISKKETPLAFARKASIPVVFPAPGSPVT